MHMPRAETEGSNLGGDARRDCKVDATFAEAQALHSKVSQNSFKGRKKNETDLEADWLAESGNANKSAACIRDQPEQKS